MMPAWSANVTCGTAAVCCTQHNNARREYHSSNPIIGGLREHRSERGYVMGKKFSREFALGLDDRRGYPLLICPNESAVATGRLRPGAAGVYFVRDDQRRSLVLSAYSACKSDRAKTTPRWLGFSCDLRDHAVVGYCVAASFVPGGSGTGGHLVPRGDCRLRSGCSGDRLGCLWPESTQCAPCDFGAHRHAARVGDLSAGTFDLAKNSCPRGMAPARAMGNVRPARRFHVHQGANRLRVFASRHRGVSMARRETE